MAALMVGVWASTTVVGRDKSKVGQTVVHWDGSMGDLKVGGTAYCWVVVLVCRLVGK